MKIRTGFVSNSSSSSFLLDKRKSGAEEIMKYIQPMAWYMGMGPQVDEGRGTVAVEGENLVLFLEKLIGFKTKHAEKIINKIGDEDISNFVYLRESDEGINGSIFEQDSEPIFPFQFDFDEFETMGDDAAYDWVMERVDELLIELKRDLDKELEEARNNFYVNYIINDIVNVNKLKKEPKDFVIHRMKKMILIENLNKTLEEISISLGEHH